jgi:hypothetical protein
MKINRSVIILHAVLVILESIAAFYMLSTEGLPVFRYYTVDSNIAQLIVSVCFLICFARRKEIPKAASRQARLSKTFQKNGSALHAA